MKEHAKTLIFTLLGNAILAFGVCAFVVPRGFMMGGANGIALTIQQFLPLRLSLIAGCVNACLFLLGLAALGKAFAAKSLLSTAIYPFILAFFEELHVETWFHEETGVCAVFAAVCIGAGVGLVVRVGGSTGGMDIPPIILQRKKGIPVGTSMMAFDGAIILMQVAFKGIDGILYSAMILFVTTIVVNRTVVSGEQKVAVTVISPQYNAIRDEIMKKLDVGVTMLDIETGYAADHQKAIYSVVYAKKYPAIRDAALRIDSHAFIVASDVKNVNGRGYTLAKKENPM